MGAGIVEQFANSPNNNLFGVATGSALGVQFPDTPLLLVRFKTNAANIGSFFLGSSAGNCNFELDSGDDTGWVAAHNLNQFFYRNPSGTADYMQYWLQR